MSLDNTAKISDIITTLQNLEGINQKADLKSALVSKGVSVADTDSMADLISKVNSANLVLNGKRWASGNFNLPGTGGTVTVQVSNLSFTPLKATISIGERTTLNPSKYRKTLAFLSSSNDINSANGSSYLTVQSVVIGMTDSGGYDLISTGNISTNGFSFDVPTFSDSTLDIAWDAHS